MRKYLLSFGFLLISALSQNAVAQLCQKIHVKDKDSTQEFLSEIKEQQKMYRKDLFGTDKMDPHFLKNFGAEKTGRYELTEVIQNYPIPQAKESVENVISRLNYVKDHWVDYKISTQEAKYFNKKILNKLIKTGESILKKNEWPFHETMDFIDVGLMFGSGLRSAKEVDEPVVDDSYLKLRQSVIDIHGKSDPSHLFMFSKDAEKPKEAYEYLPHPALVQPFFVQDRLFDIREFNWAMTKGAFLITVAPHKDVNAHDVSSSYWAFYHDLSGHYRGTAVKRTLSFLEAVYNKKGLKKIDDANGNKNEAKKLLESYVKLRESFLNDLLSKGEKKLSPEDQILFHDELFTYLHEGEGGSIEPVRMLKIYREYREQTPVNLFIAKTLENYIKTHDVSAFQYQL